MQRQEGQVQKLEDLGSGRTYAHYVDPASIKVGDVIIINEYKRKVVWIDQRDGEPVFALVKTEG